MKERDARIAALERETADLKAKQNYFEAVAARLDALELRLNFPVQVQTTTILGDDVAAVAQ